MKTPRRKRKKVRRKKVARVSKVGWLVQFRFLDKPAVVNPWKNNGVIWPPSRHTMIRPLPLEHAITTLIADRQSTIETFGALFEWRLTHNRTREVIPGDLV